MKPQKQQKNIIHYHFDQEVYAMVHVMPNDSLRFSKVEQLYESYKYRTLSTKRLSDMVMDKSNKFHTYIYSSQRLDQYRCRCQVRGRLGQKIKGDGRSVCSIPVVISAKQFMAVISFTLYPAYISSVVIVGFLFNKSSVPMGQLNGLLQINYMQHVVLYLSNNSNSCTSQQISTQVLQIDGFESSRQRVPSSFQWIRSVNGNNAAEGIQRYNLETSIV